MEILLRMARLFEVSLDNLAFDDREEFRGVQIADLELLQKLQAIDKLPDEDKTTVKAVLDTFILKSRFHELVGTAPGG